MNRNQLSVIWLFKGDKKTELTLMQIVKSLNNQDSDQSIKQRVYRMCKRGFLERKKRGVYQIGYLEQKKQVTLNALQKKVF